MAPMPSNPTGPTGATGSGYARPSNIEDLAAVYSSYVQDPTWNWTLVTRTSYPNPQYDAGVFVMVLAVCIVARATWRKLRMLTHAE